MASKHRKADREPVLKPQDATSARLGRQFRAIREMRGLGLRPLALEMGITFFCIRRHEAGTLMLRTDDLVKAAKALRCTACDLTDTSKSIDAVIDAIHEREGE